MRNRSESAFYMQYYHKMLSIEDSTPKKDYLLKIAPKRDIEIEHPKSAIYRR